MKLKRIIAALFILPVLVAWIYFLPPFPYFLVLLIVVGMLALREFYVMYGVSKKISGPGVIIGGVFLYILCRYPLISLQALCIVFFLLLFLRMVIIRTPSGSMSDIGPLGVGLLYICVFLSFQWLLRSQSSGLEYLLFLYASVWTADSMAYYIGTYVGKNKLYPALSPNKTIEGALGSIIGGALGALVIKLGLDIPVLSVTRALLIGAILGTVTIIGDLIESMFKRDAGVKDSSSLIPGHGGILDKLDGLLVAGPVLYFIVRYFK
ncbi:phosphatidate cytidylyltransferase [bacterium]|nr:MAG: phosphatidate cytidylyltransferase [bacterium]